MSCSVMVSDISRLWGTNTSWALFVDLTWPGRVLGTWSVQPTSKQPIPMFLKLKLDLINQVPKILHYCLDRYLVHRRFPILWSARGGRCTCKKKKIILWTTYLRLPSPAIHLEIIKPISHPAQRPINLKVMSITSSKSHSVLLSENEL